MDLIKDRYSNEKLKLEEKCVSERDELKSQLSSLESKFEEVIKEKAQILFKHGQLIENNRELNSLLQNKEAIGEQKLNETKTKLEYYINKCNDLEKEIAESQENHLRDTEEWKKFQADLQTAVRVANDFMNGYRIFFTFILYKFIFQFLFMLNRSRRKDGKNERRLCKNKGKRGIFKR